MTTKRTAKQNAEGQATNRHLNRASYQRGNEQSANEFLASFGGRTSLRFYKRHPRDREQMLAINAGIMQQKGWPLWQPNPRS